MTTLNYKQEMESLPLPSHNQILQVSSENRIREDASGNAMHPPSERHKGHRQHNCNIPCFNGLATGAGPAMLTRTMSYNESIAPT
jgi:hypothetical protein